MKFTLIENKDKGEYYVFNDLEQPIMAITEYVSGAYDALNTKRRATIALKHWFEYLDHLGLHYARAETKHLLGFHEWMMTLQEYRGKNVPMLHKKKAIEKSTWNSYIGTIGLFYKFYAQLKYPDCAIEFKEENTRYSPHSHSPDQVHKFSQQAKKTDIRSKTLTPKQLKEALEFTNERDSLITRFMYDTGIRLGELFNIDKNEFRNVPRAELHPTFQIYIHDSYSYDIAKKTKTGGRTIDMDTTIAEEIQSYIDNYRIENDNDHHEIFTSEGYGKDGSVPGDPMRAENVRARIKECMKMIGIKATPHWLRHSNATNNANAGVNVQDVKGQLGHKNLSTTSVYISTPSDRTFSTQEAARREVRSILQTKGDEDE